MGTTPSKKVILEYFKEVMFLALAEMGEGQCQITIDACLNQANLCDFRQSNYHPMLISTGAKINHALALALLFINIYLGRKPVQPQTKCCGNFLLGPTTYLIAQLTWRLHIRELREEADCRMDFLL